MARIAHLSPLYPPGYPVFIKRGYRQEQRIYHLLGSHPRIIPIIDIQPDGRDTILPWMENGDLGRYLIQHSHKIPIQTRIIWAIEIAQGIAHLHSKQVIWADTHFGNILLTDDFHVVLIDFAYSVVRPGYFYEFAPHTSSGPRGPPTAFAFPTDIYKGSRQPYYTDILSFGIILFALLDLRFPFSNTLSPTTETSRNTLLNYHGVGKFDCLKDKTMNKYFGWVLDACFHASFSTGDILVQSLLEAYSGWSKSGLQAATSSRTSTAVPYPITVDLSIPIHPVPPIPFVEDDPDAEENVFEFPGSN